MAKATLSDTAHGILTTGAEHPDRLATLPPRLPAAAQRAVIASLLKAGLLVETEVVDGQPLWRTSEDSRRYGLHVTDAGLEAAGLKAAASPGGDEVSGSTVPASSAVSSRPTLRAAAQSVMAVWNDDLASHHPMLAAAVEALRSALASAHPTRTVSASPCQPRPDTKRAAVLALLRRPEGATVAQVAGATGWAMHTVRGFFAGLKSQGVEVTVLERVRQVGPGKQGAKGSYSVYRVEAG